MLSTTENNEKLIKENLLNKNNKYIEIYKTMVRNNFIF